MRVRVNNPTDLGRCSQTLNPCTPYPSMPPDSCGRAVRVPFAVDLPAAVVAVAHVGRCPSLPKRPALDPGGRWFAPKLGPSAGHLPAAVVAVAHVGRCPSLPKRPALDPGGRWFAPKLGPSAGLPQTRWQPSAQEESCPSFRLWAFEKRSTDGLCQLIAIVR